MCRSWCRAAIGASADAGLDDNAAQLSSWAGCQLAVDGDVDGDVVAVAVDGAFGPVFGDGAFDDAGTGSAAAGREQVIEHGVADLADETDGGVGDDSGGLDDLVAGGVEGDAEARAVSGARWRWRRTSRCAALGR